MTNKEALAQFRATYDSGANYLQFGREPVQAAIRALEFEDTCATKDEAAERIYCFGVAQELLNAHIQPLEERVERERAQARGEGYAAGRADQSKVPCTSHYDALTAAQAEIERLETLFQQTCGVHVDWVSAQRELSTKLANLRAAAQLYYGRSDARDDRHDFEFWEAIEASK